MSYLMINDQDVSHLVKSLKVGYETLVADNSGRNAAGDTVLDIVNSKVKLYVGFRPMDSVEMRQLLGLIKNYVISVKFKDPQSNRAKTITAYTGTPEPEYYWILGNQVLYKDMDLNFIEM